MTAKGTDIYRGQDPRGAPICSVSEATHHLRLPRSTVQAWVRRRGGRAPFRRVIMADDAQGARLSFRNLVEIHVLSALGNPRPAGQSRFLPNPIGRLG